MLRAGVVRVVQLGNVQQLRLSQKDRLYATGLHAAALLQELRVANSHALRHQIQQAAALQLRQERSGDLGSRTEVLPVSRLACSHATRRRQQLLRLRVEAGVVDQAVAEHAEVLANQRGLHVALQLLLEHRLNAAHDLVGQVRHVLAAATRVDAVHKAHLTVT